MRHCSTRVSCIILSFLLVIQACLGFQPNVNVALEGGDARSGRVVVYKATEFGQNPGTICGSDGFNDKAATVICRQLTITSLDGMRWDYGKVAPATQFSPWPASKGSILISKVNCSGGEALLAACTYQWNKTSKACTHANDAAVRCFRFSPPPPRPDGRVDYQAPVRLTLPSSLNPTSNFDQKPSTGRVEMNLGGPWLAVCADKFDNKAAEVSCHQMGFQTGYILDGPMGDSLQDHITVPELVNVRCNGTESFLSDCQYKRSTAVPDCPSARTATVRCYTPPPPPPPASTKALVSVGCGAAVHTLYQGPRSWAEAESDCVSRGGHLSSFESAAAYSCVAAKLGNKVWAAPPNDFCIYIGGYATASTNCSWKWSDGTKFAYKNFFGGSDDCYGDRSYAHIMTTKPQPSRPDIGDSTHWGVVGEYDSQPSQGKVYCSYMCETKVAAATAGSSRGGKGTPKKQQKRSART